MPTRHEMMLRRVRCTAAVWLIRGPFHVSKQTIELLPRATARRCLRASLRVENPRLSAGSIISLSSSGKRGKKNTRCAEPPPKIYTRVDKNFYEGKKHERDREMREREQENERDREKRWKIELRAVTHLRIIYTRCGRACIFMRLLMPAMTYRSRFFSLSPYGPAYRKPRVYLGFARGYLRAILVRSPSPYVAHASGLGLRVLRRFLHHIGVTFNGKEENWF